MRRLLALLAFLLVTCSTTAPAPSPSPSPAPPSPPAAPPAVTQTPCVPGEALINAATWVMTSAEYKANAVQTFAAARRALDEALADPTRTGAVEETNDDPKQPPAIVLDLDETAILNTPFEARVAGVGKTYDADIWKQWVGEAGAAAVPGAAEFLQYAKSRGVTPFYVTNRDEWFEADTRRNLEKLGFPLDPGQDTLLTRGEGEWKGSSKSSRRAFVASKYRLVMLLGDDLNDFTDALGKSVAERDQIVRDTQAWWGTRWFILPNPMYGSWESALPGSDTPPCGPLQKKKDALKAGQ